MPFILGDHNDSLMQRYRAEFDTVDGKIELECWAVSSTDAAGAFMRFFRKTIQIAYNSQTPQGCKIPESLVGLSISSGGEANRSRRETRLCCISIRERE